MKWHRCFNYSKKTLILVDILSELYIHGETTYHIEESGKVKTVSVNRTEFHLSEEAQAEYESLHDEWEVEICKKHPHDPLIAGTILVSFIQLLLKSLLYCFPQDLTKIIASNPFCN